MATMVMDTALSKSVIAIAILGAIASNASAGEINFSPQLLATETYTDNVELSRANEESSFVTQLGVGLNFVYEAQHLQVNWASESNYASYTHDHELDDDFHSVNSSLSWVVWPKGIRILASANVENQSRSNGSNSLADIVSGDTVRVESYSTGLAYDVSNSDFNISSQVSFVTSNAEDNIGERDGYQISLNGRNGKSSRHFFWETNGSYQDLENDNNTAKFYRAEIKAGWISGYYLNPFVRYYDEDNKGAAAGARALESNSVGIGIRWMVTPRLYLELSYNDPLGEQLDTDGNEQESYYDANLMWQPNQRTSVNISRSQRFYGDSYNVNIQHQNRRLKNQISYSEEVLVFTRNNLEPYLEGLYWCPQNSDGDLNECFVGNDQAINFDDYRLVTVTNFNVLEDQQYSLNKQLAWLSTFSLPRTNFELSVDRRERTDLESQIEDIYDTLSFSVSRKVSGKSDLSLSLNYTDNTFQKNTTNERKDIYRRYSISYKKKLNSQFSFDFGISALNRSSDLERYNYDENRVHFKFTKEF